MGRDTEFNVYALELEAIHMAVTQLKSLGQYYNKCRIFVDTQEALKVIQKPNRQSGKSFINAILNTLGAVYEQYPQFIVHLEWIPGHGDIEGNEKADQVAKQAAIQLLNGEVVGKLKAARSKAIYQAIKYQWQNKWVNGREDSCQLRNMTSRPNTISGSQIYQQLGTIESILHRSQDLERTTTH